ncbi:MAG: hypothetical protein ABIS01_05370 [Ferruginibacter sp.]
MPITESFCYWDDDSAQRNFTNATCEGMHFSALEKEATTNKEGHFLV